MIALLVGVILAPTIYPLVQDDPAKDIQAHEVYRKLHVGMTVQEVENTIRPVLLDSGRQSEGGSGRSTRVYHLREDCQFYLRCDGYPKFDNVIEIGKLEPKKPWRKYTFEPSEKERAVVVEIATAALLNEIKAGRDPSALFPTNPAGRTASRKDVTTEVELNPGTKTKLTVSVGEGRWQNHKLVRVNFLKEKDWLYQVEVDMNEQKAVPSRWVPTEQDIVKARAIADPAIEEFLGKSAMERSTVKVRGWGDYDYGPLRRLVVLVYSKPNGLGESLKFVVVDFENGKLNDK
ncbi:MAG: hypothetical protein QM775_28340 [Pirellulales bacterium]